MVAYFFLGAAFFAGAFFAAAFLGLVAHPQLLHINPHLRYLLERLSSGKINIYLSKRIDLSKRGVQRAMVNHYDVLGVGRDSGQEEIKQAYHRLAMEYHPDKNPSPRAAEKMKQINEAYRILGDPGLRADYDRRALGDTGGNIYARWYGKRPDVGNEASRAAPGPNYAYDGYEAPRRTVVHQSVIFFSFEHLLAGAIVGLAFGIAITAAFIYLGLGSGDQPYGLASMMLYATVPASIAPVVSVLLTRGRLSGRSEAAMCGSITMTFALPIAVLAGSSASTTGDTCTACCLLPFAGIIAGWLIGGFAGRASWDIFRG
jgi:hypothetical protein